MKTTSPIDYAYTWAMCSDGRILVKSGDEAYRVAKRGVAPDRRTEDILKKFVQMLGHKITEA